MLANLNKVGNPSMVDAIALIYSIVVVVASFTLYQFERKVSVIWQEMCSYLDNIKRYSMLAGPQCFAYKRQLSFDTALSSVVLDLNTKHLSSNPGG